MSDSKTQPTDEEILAAYQEWSEDEDRDPSESGFCAGFRAGYEAKKQAREAALAKLGGAEFERDKLSAALAWLDANGYSLEAGLGGYWDVAGSIPTGGGDFDEIVIYRAMGTAAAVLLRAHKASLAVFTEETIPSAESTGLDDGPAPDRITRLCNGDLVDFVRADCLDATRDALRKCLKFASIMDPGCEATEEIFRICKEVGVELRPEEIGI